MKTMIKKYKRIGALLLGLSCLTMGFFTPVDTYGGFYVGPNLHKDQYNSYKNSQSRRVFVADMTTKELFNVVYGVLREKSSDMVFVFSAGNTINSESYEPFYSITFTMMPQSADDYGLITIRFNQIIYYYGITENDANRHHELHVNHYVDFYIDKGSSSDKSVLRMEDHYGDIYMTGNYYVSSRLYESTICEGSFSDVREGKVVNAQSLVKTWKDEFFDTLSARVKRTSSFTQRESPSVQRESPPIQNESTSAPSRSSRE